MLVAEYVFVESTDGMTEFLPIEEMKIQPKAYREVTLNDYWYGPTHITETTHHNFVQPHHRMIFFRHHRYLLSNIDTATPTFILQSQPTAERAAILQHRLKHGLTQEERTERQISFGINQLQIMVPTYPQLLMRELFHPFFIFQFYSVILWCFEVNYRRGKYF